MKALRKHRERVERRAERKTEHERKQDEDEDEGNEEENNSSRGETGRTRKTGAIRACKDVPRSEGEREGEGEGAREGGNNNDPDDVAVPQKG